MLILARALTYATLFVGLLLVYLPSRVLSWSGVTPRDRIGPVEVLGMGIALLGAVLALWSVLAFAFIGRGTPAPFDPPRELVIAGPYRYVRNPMYIGAGLAVLGAALYYRSLALALFVAGFWAAAHLFILGYEEPTLIRLFGAEYAEYRERVSRWVPRLPDRSAPAVRG